MPAPLHIALLRGINVGGKNRLKMADLAACFVEVGCEDVGTYIQSGNVVFRASATVARDAAERVRGLIAERHGIEAPVITRSAKEWGAVAHGIPFHGPQADPASLHVAFLARKPAPKGARALDPGQSPGDAFKLVGREVYLHLPNGVSRTKLTNAYLDRTLGTLSTARNWKTVLKLAELAGVS